MSLDVWSMYSWWSWREISLGFVLLWTNVMFFLSPCKQHSKRYLKCGVAVVLAGWHRYHDSRCCTAMRARQPWSSLHSGAIATLRLLVRSATPADTIVTGCHKARVLAPTAPLPCCCVRAGRHHRARTRSWGNWRQASCQPECWCRS